MSAWERDFCEAVEAALAERLEGRLSPGEGVSVQGESGEDVRALITLRGGPSGAQFELEARVSVGPDGAKAAQEAALDALDLLLLEYLDAGRVWRTSGIFESRELAGRALQVRLERTFPELDAQANRLLGDDAGRS